MPRHTASLVLLLGGLLPIGCSLLLDRNQQQCADDQDCTRFAAVCNRDTGLCGPALPSAPAGPAPGAASAGHDQSDAGEASALPEPWPCRRPNKPVERLEADMTTSRQLTCERDYLLVGSIGVKAGAVLTIDPGTTILGDVATKGHLAVERGARLVADGLRMAPIIFTSSAPPAMRRAGDWGGVVLFGQAWNAATDADAAGLRAGDQFGGQDDGDSSGVLRFVRIEYAGAGTGTSGGASALTLGSVGRGTTLSYVQVRQSGQDCFKFLGGTVNGKHLVGQGCVRNGIAWESGYRGKLQFLLVQQTPAGIDGGSGAVVRNGLASPGGQPSEPVVYNATFCGRAADVPGEQYGIVIAGGARAHLANALFAGFEAGIDVRDAGSEFDLRSSVFWVPIAYEEDGSNSTNQANDDGGLDEAKLFLEAGRQNALGRPNFGDCFDANRMGFAPIPSMRTGASKPPDDGFFDSQAVYLGALRDQTDPWLRGEWLQWSER